MVNPSSISGSSRHISAVEPNATSEPRQIVQRDAQTALPTVSQSLVDDMGKKVQKDGENLASARKAATTLLAALNDPSADSSVKAKAAQALVDKIAIGALSAQLARNALDSGLELARSAGQPLSSEKGQQISNELAPVLGKQLDAALSGSGIERGIGARASFDDILDGLQDLIGTIKDDYLDVYARLVELYAKLYSDFNSEVLANMAYWIVPLGDAKGSIQIDIAGFKRRLLLLMDRYTFPKPDSILFPVPGAGGAVAGASKEDAEKWLAAMGLPPSCLKQLPDGTYCVVIDLLPLTRMINGLPAADSNGKATLLPAAFQAWQAGFNAQQQELESALQKHTQKYSNANSIHDNVQKVISSTLSALFEMLKAFSAALG